MKEDVSKVKTIANLVTPSRFIGIGVWYSMRCNPETSLRHELSRTFRM